MRYRTQKTTPSPPPQRPAGNLARPGRHKLADKCHRRRPGELSLQGDARHQTAASATAHACNCLPSRAPLSCSDNRYLKLASPVYSRTSGACPPEIIHDRPARPPAIFGAFQCRTQRRCFPAPPLSHIAQPHALPSVQCSVIGAAASERRAQWRGQRVSWAI
jgi:hypothetical protein